MEYHVVVRDTSESMRLADEDWKSLIMLAGTFGWRPVAGIDYYLSIPPPDVIPDSVSRYLADTLNRVIPTLPDRGIPINVALPQEGVSFMDLRIMELRNYFCGQRKGVLEEFVRLCQLGDLSVRRRLQP